MAKVVGKCQRLRQILVEAELARDRSGDLGHLDTVRQARAEEIADMIDEDLRLILQLTESRAVDDAVAVTLPGAARGRLRLGMQSPARGGGLGCVGGLGHGVVIGHSAAPWRGRPVA